MATDQRAELAKIKRLDQLIPYLRDEMGWPIAKDSFEDADDLFYEFTPDELGIDPKTAAKIESIKRLRPLSTKQPWGIFFVKFEPKKLPVVALRRLLSQVALKKRASANSAERAAWAVDDLLFVSNYGEGDERQITFAHFSQAETKHDLPTLKVLGWDNLDTPLHLDNVAETLSKRLAWPDDEDDVAGWRDAWRSAFTLRDREVITTSRDLSVRLAELARAIRDLILTALAIETEAGPLTKLLKAFREALVHDLDADGFADMYAQTIAYGLLSARIANPRSGSADDLSLQMPVTNPFLKELMETFLHVGGRRGKASGPDIDFDELGVSEVVELLDRTNMEAVVRDFGDRNPQEDPVIHFYEHFLAAYDKTQKIKRGVFYTPRPVVSYIIRSTHELLRTGLGLEDGLADTTTWGEMAARHSALEIPEGVDPQAAFVQILDPATGTGTFLVEVVDLVHKTLTEKWTAQGLDEKEVADRWNHYVPKHLLPRVFGYELQMAPYAIAHLKVGLKLLETGYRFTSTERTRIFLTNALEPAHDFSGQFEFAIPALAHEAQAVNTIKSTHCFTVVVGNPPYSVLSANLTPTARSLVTRYRQIDGQAIKERSMLRLEMHLQDDYVKFLALIQQLLHRSGHGVVGLITNRGYIDNLTLRGVRFALLQQFHHICITDLHGSHLRATGSAEKDENVFDIEQGVAIAVVAANLDPDTPPVVNYIDLRGGRALKYSVLANETVCNAASEPLTPTEPNFFFVPRDESGWSEYKQFVSLPDAMPVNISGIVTAHDHLVVDFDSARLIENVCVLQDSDLDLEEAREILGVKDNAGWKLAKARAAVADVEDDQAYLRTYAYRPFDLRRIYYHPALVWSDRRKVMSHMLGGDNVALATCRQLAQEPWEHIFVTRDLQDACFVSNRTREISYQFPVHLRGDAQQRGLQASLLAAETEHRPNFAREFMEALCAQLGLTLDLDDDGECQHLCADDIFHYVYAVFFSPTYRTRYSEFLKIDFPRIPLPASDALFREIAVLGRELVALHLLKSPTLDRPMIAYVGPPSPEVTRVSRSEDAVWLNAAATKRGAASAIGTVGFRGVSDAVWNFRIGSYRVCEKWLKDRKGRTLTDEEIACYQRIAAALHETTICQVEIDRTIQQHGGWPTAFVTTV